jgi:hypothetical protein
MSKDGIADSTEQWFPNYAPRAGSRWSTLKISDGLSFPSLSEKNKFLGTEFSKFYIFFAISYVSFILYLSFVSDRCDLIMTPLSLSSSSSSFAEMRRP